MTKSISPSILKQLREEQALSLDQLAKKSKVDRGTIHRIEQGKQPKQRQATIERLGKALKVDEDELTGKVPRIADQTVTDKRPRQHLSVRIGSSSRNALTLVARRYDVPISQVVEAAPLLFFLAAERSLQQRREKLMKLKPAIDELAGLCPLGHLPPEVNYEMSGILACEEKSIKERDLFGGLIDEASIRSDYEEEEQNPFVVSLREEITKVTPEAEIIWPESLSWSHLTGPDYHICFDEALAYVGGDGEAASAILLGTAPLTELPKELRGEEVDPGKRAEWAKQQALEFFRQINEASAGPRVNEEAN